MGAVKDVVMEIREEITDLIGADKIIDNEVKEDIAVRLKIPVQWVQDAYKDIMDDYYGDW